MLPRDIISLVFATGDFLNCFQCQLCEPMLEGQEDSMPSRLVLIPCLVTGGEHRDSSTSSAPSPAFISVLVIFMLAASRGGGPGSLLPIHLSVHPMTHAVIQGFSSLLLLSAILLSFSMKEKYVLD